MKIEELHITSTTKPAGGGCLPTRVILHICEGTYPLVTHFEIQKEDGRWARGSGCYFDDLGDALANFYDRCKMLGVH